MAAFDRQGRAYVCFPDLRPGMQVRVDGDFSCIEKNDVRTVEKDDHGWYIACRGPDGRGEPTNRHYLDGQEDYQDSTDAVIGVYPV